MPLAAPGKRSRLLLPPLVIAAATSLLFACGGGDSSSDPAALASVDQLKATCAAVVGKTFAGATVTAAHRIEANTALGSPGFCQVLATRAPYLDIEVDVPDTWSGRIWQQGGSGFDGTIRSAISKDASGSITAINIALAKRSAIYAASNGGNRASVAAQAAPAVWVNGTADGQKAGTDYAYAALGTTLFFSKAMAQEFFKRAPAKTYFNGCSNGGRNAYIALQRWPGEYDGVVSGCEGMDMAGQTVAWMNMARLAGTPAMPTQSQWTSLFNAAVTACDANDGLKDGVIANHSACTFNAATQQCGQPGASGDPAVCLSAAQLQTVQSLLGTLTSATGQTIYSGHGWANWSAPGFGGLGGGFMALATGDSAWLTSAKQASFDLNTNHGPIIAGLQAIGADHDKIAIAAFVASGKKLIHWHDGADGLLSLPDHARNIATMHGIAKSQGLADPAASSRFFVVPGTGHSGASALTAVDWSDAIINWVENNTPPAQLTYNSKTAAGASKAIPVCQHPMYPRYAGGDANMAASYVCTAP